MKKTPLLLALIIAVAVPTHATEEAGARAGTWAGAGGLVLPIDRHTPVRIDFLRLLFTAVDPPRRTLDNPRFAQFWEVSTRMTITNGSDQPYTLKLVFPEVPAANGDRAPIRKLVVSLDTLRLPTQTEKEPRSLPPIKGAPGAAYEKFVEIPFEPGESHSVDTLYRAPATYQDGVVWLNFLTQGATLYAGETIPKSRFEVRFGERVRLVDVAGKKLPAIAAAPPGAEHWFNDDGRNTRLRIQISDWRPTSTWVLPAKTVGQTKPNGVALLGPTVSLTDLSPIELDLLKHTQLALRGRQFRDPIMRRIFEELPWEGCNPAQIVASGGRIGEASIAEFIAAHPCTANCADIRTRSVDPYGSPWQDPLCWYSPVHNRTRTQVNQQQDKAQIIEIDRRLAQATASGAEPRDERLEQAPPASGCGCRLAGHPQPAGSPYRLLWAVVSSIVGGDQ